LPITSATRLPAKAGWQSSADNSAAVMMAPKARMENPLDQKALSSGELTSDSGNRNIGRVRLCELAHFGSCGFGRRHAFPRSDKRWPAVFSPVSLVGRGVPSGIHWIYRLKGGPLYRWK
jgi:hypothetical protein